MSFKPLLRRIAEKTAPGRSPSYGEAQVLRALETVSGGWIGRASLGERLGVGEGVVRTLIRRLSDEGLIEVSTRGVSISKKGEGLLRDVHSVIATGGEAPATGDMVGSMNFALLVKGGAHGVRFGLEQRDAALIAGARGATTIVFKQGSASIPGMEGGPSEPLLSFIQNFRPQKGDVVVVGSADNLIEAENGAYAAALTLA
ncbi:TPA: hypothetical protein HA344_00235 [Candidatus Bathyarchaeota archaeon]|nr:hypothetical protein [Candidatus Bathyarchaeota archaeon]